MAEHEFLPLTDRHVPDQPPAEVLAGLYEILRKRRSIRSFRPDPVPREVIEGIVRVATTAPSGANKQPWRFVAIQDPELKKKIRAAAEAEEREFYGRRANDEWLEDLNPLGTDANKEFLEVAPWLVVVFALYKDDDQSQVYYVKESVGLASGMFLAAAHMAGLGTLTHTPSPMGFLREILGRPKTEKPFLLIPVGYPTEDCTVPAHAIPRKPIEQVLLWDCEDPLGTAGSGDGDHDVGRDLGDQSVGG